MNLKKRKGFADGGLLVQILIYCMIAGVITTSLVTLQSSQYSSLTAGRVELEAQQWADIKANTVKLMNYTTIANQQRQIIQGSNNEWEDEIIVGSEQIITPENKQKIITVNIYKPGEGAAKFSLKVPLSSQGSSTGVPVGTVIIWASWANPDNTTGTWLECNGQWINPGLYPKLAAMMSNTPNYQGVFLRGVGSVVSGHYGYVEHWSAGLGELQGDSIRNIYGTAGDFAPRGWNGTGAMSVEEIHIGSHRDNSGSSLRITFDASRVVPVSNEIRPVNKAVRYLIRAS